MARPMKTAPQSNAVSQAVTQVGGPTKASHLCQASVFSIYRWIKQGFIPNAFAANQLAHATGIPLELLVGGFDRPKPGGHRINIKGRRKGAGKGNGHQAGPVAKAAASVSAVGPTDERTILLDKEATVVSVRVQLPDGGVVERGIEDNGTGLRRDVVIRAKLRGLVLVASLACATTAGAGDVDYRLVNRRRRAGAVDKLAA